MSVSVITIVADRATHLTRMLSGMTHQRCRPDEVIVVDMGSTDGPEATVEAAGDLCVRVVRCGNGGLLPLAAARNAGARAATGDVLVFIDVDCIGSYDLVAAHADAVWRGGIVAGPVRYLERFWDAGLGVGPYADGVLWARSAPHPVRPVPERECVDERHELFWSLLFAVDRTTWNRVGGFDEAYVGYGGEDTDFALRARAAGVPMRWIPDGLAFHQWHATSDPPVEHLASIVANAERFHRRWGRWPMEGWLQSFTDAGYTRWCEGADEIALVADAAVPRRLRVRSIPSSHPYTRRVVPDSVDVFADPTEPWWPHRSLEPGGVDHEGLAPDLVHLHFGFEHRTPGELARWCDHLATRRIPLVVTIHDLDNPHCIDQCRHDQQLEILTEAASEVITLTHCARAHIFERWGRDATVIDHPGLTPPDALELVSAPARRPDSDVPPVVSVDFKEMRTTTLDPAPFLMGVAHGARSGGADVLVTVGSDARRADQRRVLDAAQTSGLDASVIGRRDDAALIRHLGRTAVSVLPYGTGTHSGWMELCRDLGARVVAPATGCYADQWPAIERFAILGQAIHADDVAAAVRRALEAGPPTPADPTWRREQLAGIRAAHEEIYRRLGRGR